MKTEQERKPLGHSDERKHPRVVLEEGPPTVGFTLTGERGVEPPNNKLIPLARREQIAAVLIGTGPAGPMTLDSTSTDDSGEPLEPDLPSPEKRRALADAILTNVSEDDE